MTDFVLIPASTLSITDDFMRHFPRTDREKAFKKLLTNMIIFGGVSDFYRPKCDPSFDSEGKICYQAGLKPAVGQTYYWWEKNAKEFCPERKSRLGTKYEYVAFLGVLIKKLVERGWSIDNAWNAVCNNSRNVGHYWNSEGALHDFEPTGSREICGFCDLGNTSKILAKDEENAGGFWLAGGAYSCCSDRYPLADRHLNYRRYWKYHFSVGWIICEK